MTWLDSLPYTLSWIRAPQQLWHGLSRGERRTSFLASVCIALCASLAARFKRYMFLLAVELGDTLDRHVIGLGRTRSKKYLLRVGADETRNLSVSCCSTCGG